MLSDEQEEMYVDTSSAVRRFAGEIAVSSTPPQKKSRNAKQRVTLSVNEEC